MREPMIPLSAVTALINGQNDFNRALVDLLGSYLERASEHYERALNPPIDPAPSVPMSFSPFNDEAEDLYHQIESGIISPGDITGNMRNILKDADMSIETT